MAQVINDVVKMDWEKDGWLQTKGKGGKPGTFIIASKEYTNSDGEPVLVLFNSTTAFIWGDNVGTDNEDRWEFSEIKSWLKTNFDSYFPASYDEYYPLIEIGSVVANPAALERYKLTEYKDDIESRLKDLLPYGEEKEVEGL